MIVSEKNENNSMYLHIKIRTNQNKTHSVHSLDIFFLLAKIPQKIATHIQYTLYTLVPYAKACIRMKIACSVSAH